MAEIRFEFDPRPAETRVEGDPYNADIEVEVTVFEDGEVQISTRCMCHACHQLEHGTDIMEALPTSVYGVPEPGVYYLKAWYETWPATINGPEEHEAGFQIAPPREPEQKDSRPFFQPL